MLASSSRDDSDPAVRADVRTAGGACEHATLWFTGVAARLRPSVADWMHRTNGLSTGTRSSAPVFTA